MEYCSHLKKGEIALYVDNYGQLMPCDGESAERYSRFKRGVPYLFSVSKKRNYDMLCKYFKMLRTAYNNQDNYDSFEWFRRSVIAGAGYAKTFVSSDGVTMIHADSISFEKCSESRFMEIYQNSINYIVNKYGFDDDFVMEVMSYA